MSAPAHKVRARQAQKPRARTSPSAKRPARSGRKAPHRPPLQVVKPRHRRRRSIAFWILAAALVGGLVLTLAATNVMLAQGAFDLQSLTESIGSLERQNGVLRLEVAQLSTSNRIASEARRLGLVLPGSIEVIHKHGSRDIGPAAGDATAVIADNASAEDPDGNEHTEDEAPRNPGGPG